MAKLGNFRAVGGPVSGLGSEASTTDPKEFPMAESRPRPYSRPVFDQDLILRSEPAQRVMAREFTRVVHALYAIDVILRIIGEPEEIDEIETLVSGLIGECARGVQGEQARLDKLREDHGVTQVPRYTNPATHSIRIVSPQVAQFVALVGRLDELMVALDALWLCGVLSNKQRAEGAYQWQQRLLRLGRRIVAIEQRARASAGKRGETQEVKELAGEAEPGDLAVGQEPVENSPSELGEDEKGAESEENG
jgi:hypothetical protein